MKKTWFFVVVYGLVIGLFASGTLLASESSPHLIKSLICFTAGYGAYFFLLRITDDILLFQRKYIGTPTVDYCKKYMKLVGVFAVLSAVSLIAGVVQMFLDKGSAILYWANYSSARIVIILVVVHTLGFLFPRRTFAS